MTSARNPSESDDSQAVYPGLLRLIHLLLAIFGIAAWLTSDLAEDYSQQSHTGFNIHSLIGLTVAGILMLRILEGFSGDRMGRFDAWIARLSLRDLRADLHSLSRLRIPNPAPHAGLAGLVQLFGLGIFSWNAITGCLIYLGIEPGSEATGFLNNLLALHRLGDILIPLFLGLHLGAVLAHILSGNKILNRMFSL